MKKIFFSVLAIAAIAACSKSEVQYADQQLEIGFAPVVKKATKVAEDDAIYNTNLPMYIFANTYNDNDASEFSVPYFENSQFAHRNGGVFGGATCSYYWPNVKTLVFSGISKSGNVNNGATPVYNLNTYTIEETTSKILEINLEGYAPGNGGAEEGDNDLMWFPTTAPYGKPATTGTPIEVTMKHACAWVTIKLKGDGTTGAGLNAWEITDVYFKDLSLSGNVVLGSSADWTLVAANSDRTDVYLAPTASSERNGFSLSSDYVDYTKKNDDNFKFSDLVVVPQGTKSLYVAYEYLSDVDNDIKFTETKEIPLTYTLEPGNTWKAGFHYIYNITIGTDEILVEPKVAEWTPKGGVIENKQF